MSAEVTPDARGRVAIGRWVPPGVTRFRMSMDAHGTIYLEPIVEAKP